MPPIDSARVAGALAAVALDSLEEEALERLATHLDLMLEWNRRVNLTAIRDQEEALRLHVAESICGLALLPPPRHGSRLRLIDLGSGNGYPALPLLIARDDLDGVLVEASQRKAAFLRAVTRRVALGDRVRVLNERVKRLSDLAGSWDVMTLRAFPDPERWIREAIASPSVDGVLAWLSSSDALRIAGEHLNSSIAVENLELPTRRECMILRFIKTK